MKMKFCITVCCLWGHALACLGQNIDSLKGTLPLAKEDSVKVDNLLLISKSFLNTDPVQAMPYAVQAKELSERIRYHKGLAFSLKNIGYAAYQRGNYVEALENWSQSLAVFESMNDKKDVANLQSNIGAVYKNQGNDSKALDYLFNSLKNSDLVNDTFRIASALINIGSVYYHKEATRSKALIYYLRALPMSEALKDNDLIGTTADNIGEIYLGTGKSDSALIYFKKAEKAFQSTIDISYALINIGKVFSAKKKYDTAMIYHQMAFDSAVKNNSGLYKTASLQGLADTYLKTGRFSEALKAYQQAEETAKQINSNYDLKQSYQGLAATSAKLSDYPNAYKFQTLLTDIKDTIYNKETEFAAANSEFNYDLQKKEGIINLQVVSIARQKLARNAFIVGFILIFVIAIILFRNYRNKIKVNKILDTQKAQIEGLLLNILPAEVSKELQQKGEATPRFYESVTVLFTDFKGFTTIADTLSPQQVVAELSECFTTFDNIMENHGLEKIKTIGDSYMCAGGIPVSNTTHPVNMIKAAFEIVSYMRYKNEQRIMNGFSPWELRVGIHTGPLVAGVVGKKKYAYDIWGTTVNIASRMESNGAPGQINISMATYELVKEVFECHYRGKIYAKNVGEIDMYFVKENFPVEPQGNTPLNIDIKVMSEL